MVKVKEACSHRYLFLFLEWCLYDYNFHNTIDISIFCGSLIKTYILSVDHDIKSMY